MSRCLRLAAAGPVSTTLNPQPLPCQLHHRAAGSCQAGRKRRPISPTRVDAAPGLALLAPVHTDAEEGVPSRNGTVDRAAHLATPSQAPASSGSLSSTGPQDSQPDQPPHHSQPDQQQGPGIHSSYSFSRVLHLDAAHPPPQPSSAWEYVLHAHGTDLLEVRVPAVTHTGPKGQGSSVSSDVGQGADSEPQVASLPQQAGPPHVQTPAGAAAAEAGGSRAAEPSARSRASTVERHVVYSFYNGRTQRSRAAGSPQPEAPAPALTAPDAPPPTASGHDSSVVPQAPASVVEPAMVGAPVGDRPANSRVTVVSSGRGRRTRGSRSPSVCPQPLVASGRRSQARWSATPRAASIVRGERHSARPASAAPQPRPSQARAQGVLSREEEHTLAVCVQDFLTLEMARASLARVLHRKPTADEMARAVATSPEDLMQRIQRGAAAKRLLLQHNQGMIRQLATQVHRALKRSAKVVALDDLMAEGTRGLLHAVRKFDPDSGYKLSTYAYPWIRQFMNRVVNKEAHTISIPMHLFDDMQRVQRTAAQLAAQLGRPPSHPELAAALRWPEYRVERAAQVGAASQASSTPVSLDSTVSDSEGGMLLAEALSSSEWTDGEGASVSSTADTATYDSGTQLVQQEVNRVLTEAITDLAEQAATRGRGGRHRRTASVVPSDHFPVVMRFPLEYSVLATRLGLQPLQVAPPPSQPSGSAGSTGRAGDTPNGASASAPGPSEPGPDAGPPARVQYRHQGLLDRAGLRQVGLAYGVSHEQVRLAEKRLMELLRTQYKGELEGLLAELQHSADAGSSAASGPAARTTAGAHKRGGH